MWTNMETKNVVFEDNVSMAIECEQINLFTFCLTTTMAMAPTKCTICFMCAFLKADCYWLKLESSISVFHLSL